METLSAANETDGREAVTPALQGFVRSFDDLGMLRETEIVVGAHVQNALATGNLNVGILR